MSRDPRRTLHVTSGINELWKLMPDMRFFQLMQWIISELPEPVATKEQVTERFNIEPGNERVITAEVRDPFYVEDDVVIATINRLYAEKLAEL